jgi:hypothetical protein
MSVTTPGAARNGMHKFANRDHSMLTAMMAVANMQGAEQDIWSVNTDFECHEEQQVEAPRPEGATPHHVAPCGAAALG